CLLRVRYYLQLPLYSSSHPLFPATSHPHLDLHSSPTRRSSDLMHRRVAGNNLKGVRTRRGLVVDGHPQIPVALQRDGNLRVTIEDRKSTRLNSSHQIISYAVFCLKKKKK